MSERDRRNQWQLLGWIFAWVLANAAISRGWVPGGAPAFTVILCHVLLGGAMMLAYRRFLQNADELQRRIQLEALALASAPLSLGPRRRPIGFSSAPVPLAGRVLLM